MRIIAGGALLLWVAGWFFGMPSRGLAGERGERMPGPVEERGLVVCVSVEAPPALRAAAAAMAEAPEDFLPLAAVLDTQGPRGPTELADAETFPTPPDPTRNWRSKGLYRLVDNHLVLIGLSESDQLLRQARGWYAALLVEPPMFQSEGYGRFTGGVGFVESLPNPWMHSAALRESGHETLLFRITGTTEEAVLLAYEAFRGGMLNGVVLAPDAQRGRPTLLDTDPLADPCPLIFPTRVELPANYAPGLPEFDGLVDPADSPSVDFNAQYMGWTQAAGDEYRSYLEASGHEPEAIWRLKWLGAGVLNRMDNDTWWNGPHRIASGNSLVLVRFADAHAAEAMLKAMPRFRWEAWEKDGVSGWKGRFAYRGRSLEDVWFKLGEDLDRRIYATAKGPWFILSTLPENITAAWVRRHVPPTE